jgi:hypothetical protein
MNPGPWNWLEIAKLATGILTPAALTILGIYIHRVTKQFEHVQWRSQKLIEKKLSVYDDLAPLLNDVLCYFTYVGAWKDVEPPQVITMKREIDKKIHLAAPLFSPSFFQSCNDFQNFCFETYTRWGQDARLRTQFDRRKEAWATGWVAKWENCFSDSPTDPRAIRKAYRL